VKRGLVLERELPEGAGRALVLATAGVRLLAEEGVEAQSGKDVGKLVPGKGWHPPLKWNPDWLPPLTWRHDLLAAGVLVEFHRLGYKVLPEAHIRRHAGAMAKVPDGLAVRDENVFWLEVESARKSGPSMRELADALCAAAEGEATPVLGHKPTHAIVAYRNSDKDERGHALNHRARVRAAVAAAASQEVTLVWARCTLRGAGVGSITFESEAIASDRAAHIFKTMDWHPDPHEAGVLVARYGNHIARLREDDYGWSYELDDWPANYQPSEAEAKRACAAAIALMT
jgi:hypothetical protein